MEDAKKNEKEPPLLQVDPKCLRDALRSFFQPIKTEDPRLDFYTMYKREATEYDTDYVKKYDEDLNTTLIFAGLFSAVSSAFVIDVYSGLKPDPNEQSAALLRAILLTLNQSAIPGGIPAIPPIQGDPPSEIVTVTCLMYASLLTSLLAAFVAMLGKQWLNRYLRNSGGSMIERCGDRQRKCDGLEKWPLHFFIEGLPVMLQASLLLLACGLCRYIWSINTSVACTLIGLTTLGVGFYVVIVIAGMSSYACPFQTPASGILRDLRKGVWRKILSWITPSKQVFSWIRQMWNRRVRLLPRRPSPPTTPLRDVQVQQPTPWSSPKDFAIIRTKNANDLRCVSWILRNITDPEALDAAVRLAGTIRWFDDGINVYSPYDQIVSLFEECFDPAGKLYPGSRDRAYYSGRAIMWINTLARCKSEDFAAGFPLPETSYTAPASDPDLGHILDGDYDGPDFLRILHLLMIDPEHTPSHSQWASNVLLHLSWANRFKLNYEFILRNISSIHETRTTVTLYVALNRLLVWCTFLGLPVEEDVLEIPDKSAFLERILRQLSKAILSAINGPQVLHKFISYALGDLLKLEARPLCLTKMVYQWCSAIWENRQNLEGWERLLLVCLEIGFRRLDARQPYIGTVLAHTEHHQGLVDIVFRSQESEAIADLLRAWTAGGHSFGSALSACAGHLVSLCNLIPFSSRLRRLIIRSVEIVGYQAFEEVGVERFIQLLDDLRVTVKDMDDKDEWVLLLLDIIRSSRGAQCSPHWYWELIAELAVSGLAVSESWWLRVGPTHSQKIMKSLIDTQEWSNLECWMATVWMLSPPETGVMTEDDLSHSMVLLFRKQPDAVQELKRWMELWSQECKKDIPESFQRLCERAHEVAQQLDAPSISLNSEG